MDYPTNHWTFWGTAETQNGSESESYTAVLTLSSSQSQMAMVAKRSGA